MAPPPVSLTLRAQDRIAVVAPHPDDDVLGCGAVLAAAAAGGVPSAVFFMTDGSRSHPGSRRYPPQRMRALREREALAALERCGVAPMAATFFRAPDGACESSATPPRVALGERLAAALIAFAPTIVFAPWRRDPHPDHRVVASLAARASARCSVRPRYVEYPVWLAERGEAHEGPMPLEVRALAFAFAVPIAAQKRAAIGEHRSQLGAVVEDDPAAFALSPAMIERACTSPELFFESARA